MRRWIAIPLMFAGAMGLVTQSTQQVSAQPPGAVAETFRTADGVELHGLFHPTQKNAATAPVVVFLYPPGPDRDMTKGDWGSLAQKLNAEGYHVFQFDWRGHGKSTTIKDKQKFWTNQYLNTPGPNFNGLIKGGPPKMPLKNDISIKDLEKRADRYLPAYLNDLAAVRVHLDIKNDAKEMNTSSIYIVGAGDAAGLGIAWLTAEWNRPAVFPQPNALGPNPTYEYIPQRLIGGVVNEGGADFGAAVWLTATRPLAMSENLMKGWVSRANMAPKIRENNPMLFLHGEKDPQGMPNCEKQSKFFYNEVLVAEPRKGGTLEKLEQTFLKPVTGAAELQGIKLLGQNATLKTEDTIVLYFAAIQKTRAKLPSKARKFDNPYYIDVRYLGLQP